MTAVQDIEPSRPIGLPFDILEEIISGIDNSFGSYRADALNTLASCSLVSRELRDVAQRRLFSCFRIFPRAVSLKKFMDHVDHAGDDDRFIRYIKKLDILYASQSPHFIGGFERFLGKLIRVEMVIFSWGGFWNECFWDRLEDHECEAFLRLLWSPSLKTVVTSPSLAPFPWVIASFFGPNVETLKVPGLVYGYKSQTVGKMQRQLAKLHPADLQPATRGTVRLKHISLLYKGGIALLLYVGAQKRRWLSLDSLQTLLVCSSQNRPLGLEIDIGLFFRLCPNLRAFCIYPGVPEWRSPFLTHGMLFYRSHRATVGDGAHQIIGMLTTSHAGYPSLTGLAYTVLAPS
ncbi:hypothetical protein D9756_009710 [Leucocoprinus leucothites]|uniref:F-box domain-containing protein n=1 Tax=Leucocoprinus leucothites TaxID=201217 RepID=A0A8H5CVM5_9AGAR|nr:hypothetical protein D9756_009710 [Leucoagaricus leucothites]